MNEKGNLIEQLDWIMVQLKKMDEVQPDIDHTLITHIDGVKYEVTSKGWYEPLYGGARVFHGRSD